MRKCLLASATACLAGTAWLVSSAAASTPSPIPTREDVEDEFRAYLEAADIDHAPPSIACAVPSGTGGVWLALCYANHESSGVRAFAAASLDDGTTWTLTPLDGVGAASAEATDAPATGAQRIVGAFLLIGEPDNMEGTVGDCEGTGGYSDFGSGMNVTIRDGTGAIIATSNTEALEEAAPGLHPELDELLDLFPLSGPALILCPVWWSADVPEVPFYEIEVGRRGTLSYSLDEMIAADWFVQMSLGG